MLDIKHTMDEIMKESIIDLVYVNKDVKLTEALEYDIKNHLTEIFESIKDEITEIELWRFKKQDEDSKKYLKQHFQSQIEDIIQKNQFVYNLFDENRSLKLII